MANVFTITTKNNCPNILADDYPYDIEVKASYHIDLYRESPKRVQYNRVFFCVVNGEKYRIREVYTNEYDNDSGIGGKARADVLIEKVEKFRIKAVDYNNEEGGGILFDYSASRLDEGWQYYLSLPENKLKGHNYLYYAEDTLRMAEVPRMMLYGSLFGLIDIYYRDRVDVSQIDEKKPDDLREYEDFYNEYLNEHFNS